MYNTLNELQQEDSASELQTIKRLIKEAMEADFQQIDIVEHHCQDEWQAGWTMELPFKPLVFAL